MESRLGDTGAKEVGATHFTSGCSLGCSCSFGWCSFGWCSFGCSSFGCSCGPGLAVGLDGDSDDGPDGVLLGL